MEKMWYYSCPVCGLVLSGDEWQDNQVDPMKNALLFDKEYQCRQCNAGLNEDELYPID